MSRHNYIFPPLFSNVAQRLCNDALLQDQNLKPFYQRLQHKTLKITVRSPMTSCYLQFTPKQIVFNTTPSDYDCEIVLSLSTLLQLHKPQDFMTLLKTQSIEINGDPKVIQSFATLLEFAHWDFTEYLTPYIGDVAAYCLIKQGKRFMHHLTLQFKQIEYDLNLALIEEWKLCANPLMVADLCENIEQLDRHLNQLEHHISRLEQV